MAGYISPAILEQIRLASDIVDVISAVVPLKRSGVTFTARCPFHREKTPSFHVNPRKQTFHCFGCHKGGDVFTFLQEYEGLDFPEAIKRLAERARIPLEFENDPAHKQKQFLKDRLLQIHEQITQRWHYSLLNEAAGERARAYLGQRGVSDEAVKLFRLGYAPESWDDTVNWGKAKQFDPEALELAGLAARKEGSTHFYGRFRNRLMFPICDDQGRVIGFSGRVLPGDDDPRKYVNSPETPLFTKSRVMFGLDKSKRAILEKQFAIVCEGQLDLITCFMAGAQNIVAPQGTAFTSEHARILKRYCNEVVLCFDSDESGQKATVRVLDDLLGSGLAIRVATVPAPHDPDTFIKQFGAAAFENLIAGAPGFFDYYLNRLCALNDIQSDKGRRTVMTSMAEAVVKTGDSTLLDVYGRKTAARLGVAPRVGVQTFFQTASSTTVRTSHEDEPAGPPAEEFQTRPGIQELWLLKLLLHYDEILDWTRSHLFLDWIQHPAVREIASHRLALDADGQPPQPAAVLDRLSSPAHRALLTEALAEPRAIPQPQIQIADLTMKLRNQSIDREIEEIERLMKQPELSHEDSVPLMRERLALAQARRQPLVPLHS